MSEQIRNKFTIEQNFGNHPGWIVYYLRPNKQASHCGFIFDTQGDAENYTLDGRLPRHYVIIKWNLFPADEAFVDMVRS